MELNIHAIVERLDDIEATIQAIKERLDSDLPLGFAYDWDGHVERLKAAKRSCLTCRWCKIEDGRACGCRYEAGDDVCQGGILELWEAKSK